MPVKAIAFDLWETLLTNPAELGQEQERLRLRRMERVLITHGFAVPPLGTQDSGPSTQSVEHAHRAIWQRCQELYWSKDVDVPCRTQIEHFLEELKLDAASFDEEALHELETAYAEAAVEIPPMVVEGAVETLQALRARGLRLGLISNTGRTPGSALRRVLEQLALAQSLDVMIFSNEHGACKPQRSIFEALRDRLGVPFEETAFVGDNLYADVHGAQSCGMRGIHFTPPLRGAAVAAPVDHGLTIEADAVVTRLADVVSVVDVWSAVGDSHRFST
jgi:putative hydrolase of the HAD superfamily